jgi:hypothetical protein
MNVGRLGTNIYVNETRILCGSAIESMTGNLKNKISKKWEILNKDDRRKRI